MQRSPWFRCHRSVLSAVHIALLLCLSCFASGCVTVGERQGDDPLQVLLAWHEALEVGQPAQAWSLLTPAAREGLGQKAFIALYERQADALIRQAKAMVDWARNHPPAEALIVEVGEHPVPLVWTRSGWRIDGEAAERQDVESVPE